jgi:hypothetical protein
MKGIKFIILELKIALLKRKKLRDFVLIEGILNGANF